MKVVTGGVDGCFAHVPIQPSWTVPRGLLHTDVVSGQRLRSATQQHRLTTVGRRAFAVHGPMVWNSLPDDFRTQQDYDWLWLWPATDRGPHCRHLSINKIWRRPESAPRSRWWQSHVAGMYSDCSTCEINNSSNPIAFSALTRLGVRKGIRPAKNWVMGCWCGYLSEARCSCLHMVQLMPLPPQNPIVTCLI